MSNRIRVLVFPVSEPPRLETIENALEPMQAIVGGSIEPVRLPGGLVLLVNEDGLADDTMMLNPRLSSLAGRPLVGTGFLCRDAGEDFASVTDHDVRAVAL